MSAVDSIMEQYAIGKPILDKLFAMPAKELRDTVKGLLGGENDRYDYTFETGAVIKESRDDEPQEIRICAYDTIEITALGIYFKPEHGANEKLLTFTKFINL